MRYAMLLCAGLGVGCSGEQPSDLVVRNLTIVDASGQSRIEFRVDDKGEASVQLRDSTGTPRVRVVVRGDEAGGPTIEVRSASGRPLVEIGEGDEIAAINLYDHSQRKRMALAVGAGEAALTMNSSGTQGILVYTGGDASTVRVHRDGNAVDLRAPAAEDPKISVEVDRQSVWAAPQ